jgi:hypothetical protein
MQQNKDNQTGRSEHSEFSETRRVQVTARELSEHWTNGVETRVGAEPTKHNKKQTRGNPKGVVQPERPRQRQLRKWET